MFPSKVRTVWIALYISVRELKEWFGELDDTDIGMDMNKEAHIYNREGYSISCSFSNNLVERIDVYKHE
ncbi:MULTISPECIES: hypothetical protein [unclassified Bacillus cereus group]|uniref:hypothetical protein n=1 Tax=unclassified Bacillus cereus group TaxID=2750818 RepID=UPI001F59E931|nr:MULTISPECIES: hypothetical protein [unclassified Bacillus cereus group]